MRDIDNDEDDWGKWDRLEGERKRKNRNRDEKGGQNEYIEEV